MVESAAYYATAFAVLTVGVALPTWSRSLRELWVNHAGPGFMRLFVAVLVVGFLTVFLVAPIILTWKLDLVWAVGIFLFLTVGSPSSFKSGPPLP